MKATFSFVLLAFLLYVDIGAKLPELTPASTSTKVNEILKMHATHKQLTPELIRRILQNYIEEIDPNKTYFLESDIHQWLHPSDELVEKVLEGYSKSDFSEFANIEAVMIKAIERRHRIEKQINMQNLPKKVNVKEFKDSKWSTSEAELLNRLEKIRALQIEASEKLSDDVKEKGLQRIAKHQQKYEEQFLTTDKTQRERLMLSNVLKATASALDTHTAYFTPDEAEQFMITVQQRLSGIGAQLRDDLNGFTVTKIVEGSPSAIGKELKVKDRIIAVNGEPVVGMDIIDVVGLIRGKENTSVTLTVIREIKEDDNTREKKMDIVVKRGDVVLKESRYEYSYEPFGKGVIGYLRLFTFYQDSESSSASDLLKAIQDIKRNHNVEGIILDLRYNTGGLLSQAVEVAGLFITKGTVVSIRDSTGTIQHLRDLDGKMAWDGPLIVLINRATASASEIVAQTLQDYGRALIIGDDHSYGKGSFQTFTLNTANDAKVNPQGEFKVTRGRYYTVSGKTPQLTGVLSDVVIPGALSEIDIGESFAKYPLQNDKIKENYDDDLADIPFTQREKIRLLYKFDLQKKLATYEPFAATLKTNSSYRIEHNKSYQTFLTELRAEQSTGEETETGVAVDFQLMEAYNVMKDLILLMDIHNK